MMVEEAAEISLVRGGTPLLAVPVGQAKEALETAGVVRIDGVLDPDTCSLLRQHILEMTGDIPIGDPADKQFVPGTRLRFKEAVDLPMDGWKGKAWTRNDVLLPLDDSLVANALRVTSVALRELLSGAVCLPGDAASGLELVECAALIARSGAVHQMVHADFVRGGQHPAWEAAPGSTVAAPATGRDSGGEDMLGLSEDIWAQLEQAAAPKAADEVSGHDSTASTNPYGQMPPRLVTFVYLQDVPTAQHGATVFLPGTANDAAHERHLGGEASARPTSAPAVLATLRAGDVVVFDASTLHFGGANTVADNERVVFYFGFARNGVAAEFDGGVQIKSATQADVRTPVSLSDCCA
jgi:hypothetical protein